MSEHSTMSFKAICLNNQSLRWLREGKYDEAGEMQMEALGHMKRSMLSHAASEGMKDVRVQEFALESVVVLDSAAREAACGQLESLLSFYPCAFSVPSLPICETEKAIALIAFLYNLGLSRHLDSLKVPATSLSRTLQTQAAKLYESALKVANLHIDDESFYVAQGLLLAVTNNFAHVCTEHWELQEATNCVSMMQCMLSNPSVLEELPAEEYSFFEMNVIAFIEAPPLSIAPAA